MGSHLHGCGNCPCPVAGPLSKSSRTVFSAYDGKSCGLLAQLPMGRLGGRNVWTQALRRGRRSTTSVQRPSSPMGVVLFSGCSVVEGSALDVRVFVMRMREDSPPEPRNRMYLVKLEGCVRDVRTDASLSTCPKGLRWLDSDCSVFW